MKAATFFMKVKTINVFLVFPYTIKKLSREILLIKQHL